MVTRVRQSSQHQVLAAEAATRMLALLTHVLQLDLEAKEQQQEMNKAFAIDVQDKSASSEAHANKTAAAADLLTRGAVMKKFKRGSASKRLIFCTSNLDLVRCLPH